MLGVEFGNTFDGRGAAACIEVDDFLVGVLEREDDRVCRERGERRVKFLFDFAVRSNNLK